jgi:hypothetical protein
MNEGSVLHLIRGKDKIEIVGQTAILKLYLKEYIRHINPANEEEINPESKKERFIVKT